MKLICSILKTVMTAAAAAIFSISCTDGKGDIVRDFVNSCKKYGIRPGIYASTTANGYLHVDNPGIVQGTRTRLQSPVHA